MAEGDGVVYNEFKERVLKGELNLATDTIKVALVTAYTPNIDTHDSWLPATATEATGAGYTTGGKALTGQTVTEDTSLDRGVFDADNNVWTNLSVGTPTHAIMYDDTHASDILIAYWEVTTPTNGGDYTLQWATTGIIYLQ